MRDPRSDHSWEPHASIDGVTQIPESDSESGPDAPEPRRRRTGIWAGMAAAVVILVPMAWIGVDRATDDKDADATSGTPTESPSATTPSATASPTAAAESPTEVATNRPTDPFDVRDLETGEAPAIAWADGRDVHTAGGETLRGVLPDGTYEFAPMGSGVLAAAIDDRGRGAVRFFHRDGRPGPRSFRIDGGLATSPEGEAVAWTRPDGIPVVVQSDGDERYQMPKIDTEGDFDAVAVTSEDCREGRTTDAGCTVFVNAVGEQPQAWLSTSHGFAERVTEQILTLTAWRDGSYAGITDYRDDGSTCSAAVAQTSDETHFETCDRRLIAYSPEGGHLLTVGSIGDGLGDGEVGIVDAATGDVLVDLASTEETQSFATRLVWEDDDHALMVTYAEGSWSVVRLGTDGSMEYAVEPREGSDLESPFILAS